MKKQFMFFLMMVFLVETQAVVRYVTPGGSRPNTGTSWLFASNDLQQMINISGPGDSIWVATGTYVPIYTAVGYNASTSTYPNTDGGRDNAFVLKADVRIYGGFVGNETSISQRDWVLNPTILSGDRGVVNDSTDNCYHVVISSGAVGRNCLDGFTITKGNADVLAAPITVNGNMFNRNYGGGMYNFNSSPMLANLIIDRNAATNGGGMCNNGSSPSFDNVTISGNTSSSNGGGMLNMSCSSMLTYVSISGNTAGSSGGGMFNQNASPTFFNVTISGNSASSAGGGMYNQSSSSPAFTNVNISGNTAGTTGGGIHSMNSSSPTFTNGVISQNAAGSEGGGMYNYNGASPTLTNITISGNTAGINGGGMYNYSSSPVLTNVTISQDSAGVEGGGIYNTNSSSPILTDVAISGNYAFNDGGGMFNGNNSSPMLTNVIISGNLADGGEGGGICNVANSPLTLTNVTISGNLSGASGGGIYNDGSCTLVIRNSIIWGNIGGGNSVFGSSASDTYAHSLIEDCGGSLSWDANFGTDLGNNLDANPQFVNWIAPTWVNTPNTLGDYRLQLGSPAIDAGNNSFVAGITTDLDGNPRIIGYTVDMGAYECQSSRMLYVNKNVSTGNGSGNSWFNAMVELSDALLLAKTLAGTSDSIREIWVAEATYIPLYSARDGYAGTDGGRDNAFLLEKNVQIYGGFPTSANDTFNAPHAAFSTYPALSLTDARNTRDWDLHPTILSGDRGVVNDSTDNCYHVVISSGNVDSARLDGFTITKGLTASTNVVTTVNGNVIRAISGGGMYNMKSSPYIANVIISQNTSTNSAGGMYNDSFSSPTLTHVVISENRATGSGGTAGGMYNVTSANPVLDSVSIIGNSAATYGGGMTNFEASPTLTHVIISQNTAGSSGGGGIYNVQYCSPTLTNVIISGNNAGGSGGGMYTGFADSSMLTNVIISGNTSNFYGGGMHNNTSSSPTLTNVIISGNNTGGSGGGMAILNNSTPTLTHVVISENTAATYGGGMYNTGSSPILDSVTISGNTSNYHGGGMYNDASSPILDSVTISQNTAAYDGGGMYNANNSSPILTDVVINGNRAIGNNGGGMHNFNSSPILTRVIISRDTAESAGGGMYNQNSSPILTDVTISQDTAGNHGGGIYNHNSYPTLTHVIISGNTATDGGGMYNNSNSSPTLTNVTVNGNSAGGGAGIHNYQSSPILTHVTISQNTAKYSGGGMYNYESSPVLDSVQISGNTAAYGGGMHNLQSSPVLDSVNISQNTAIYGGGMYNQNSSPILTDVTISQDTAGNYGGGMYNYESSPVLTRVIISQDTAPDGGGMYNTSSSPILDSVTISQNTATNGGGMYNTTSSSPILTDVVINGNRANTNGGGMYNTTSSSPILTRVIISQDTAGNFGGGMYNTASSPILTHVTISQDTAGNSGGGIYNTNSSPILDSVIISRNTAGSIGGGVYNAANSAPEFTDVSIEQNRAGIEGGGMFNTASSPELTNVTINGNYAGTFGGGMYNTASSAPILTDVVISGNRANFGGGMGNNNSSPTLTNVTISQDTASNYGGGMYNINGSSASLTNVSISENRAGINGGGMYNNTSSPMLINVIIGKNNAGSTGGGIFNEKSSPTLTNVLIMKNHADYDGAMYNDINSSAVLTHTTISGNTATMQTGGIENDAAALAIGNSIIWGNTHGLTQSNISGAVVPLFDSCLVGGYAAPGVILDADPLFADTAKDDYRLTLCSPAIDKGDASLIPSRITVDLDSNPRIFGTYPDLGAYEFQYPAAKKDTTYYEDTICQGKTYSDANFTNLTLAGTYYDTLQNGDGCDSLLIFTLIYYPSVPITFDTVNICAGDSYNFGGKVLSVSGTYYDTLPNVNGCDSVIQLAFGVYPSVPITHDTVNICAGGTYNFAGKVLSSAGTYFDTLQNVNACDSVIQLAFGVYPSVPITFDTVNICAGKTYNFAGKVLSSAGTYYDTLQNINSCDSVIQLAFGVYPSVPITHDTVNICAGETYNFAGKVLSSAGTYFDTLQNVNACDSVIQLTFGIYPSVPITFDTVNICAGKTYNFAGKVLSSAGTYYDTLYNINSCDSVIQLAFGVYPSVPITHDTVNICFGETYNFAGKVLSSAGTYYDTLQNVNSCDSVIQLAFGVYPSVPITFDTVNICTGDSYNFGGKVLSSAGTYYDTLQNVNNCDSVIQLAFGVYPTVPITHDTVNICTGDSYNFGGKVLSVSGTYYDTLQNVNACDSVIQLAFGVYPNVPITHDTVNICTGDSYNFGGKVLSVSGTYYDTLPNVNGCDSVIQLAFGVYPSVPITHDTVNICAGKTYNFAGKVLSVSGTYYDTLYNINGCDSVIQLAFGVYPNVPITHDTVNICAGKTYNFAGKVLSSAGTYYDTLPNVNGCDSVIQLAFGVYPNVPITFDTVNICTGDSYNFGGKVLSSAGTYYDTLYNINSCDSVIQLELTVNSAITTYIFDTICDGATYNFNGKSLTTADVYRDTLQAIGGCDSVIELELTVNFGYFIQIKDTICDGATYNFNGKSLTTADVYRDTLQAVSGCDSVIQLELTVNTVLTTHIFDTICDGATYNFNGKSLTTADTYRDTLQAVSGCDSVIELELTVSSAITTYIFDTICDGATYNFNGKSLTTADTYRDTLQAVSGCDSVIALELAVNSAIITYIFDTICDGATYNFNGKSLTTADVYHDTLQSVSGCDSVIQLELAVNFGYFIQIKDTICDGGTYNFNGKSLTTADTYYDTLQAIGGCDSVIELTLTVNPVYNVPIAASICQGDTYNFNGKTLTTADIYHDTLPSINGCDSVIELTLTVNSVPTTYIFDTIYGSATYNFNGRILTTADIYHDTLPSVNGCDSVIELTLTYYPSSPDSNRIMYVNKYVLTGNGSGDSWYNAMPELADALLAAKTLNAVKPDSIREIWVAEATYIPLYNPTDDSTGLDGGRDNAFLLVKNVQIYGGFPTNADDTLNAPNAGFSPNPPLTITQARNTRNWNAYPAILSGDRGVPNDSTDNCYHVVISSGDVGNACLDGFTITKGNADSTASIMVNSVTVYRYQGGGMNIYSSSPTLANLIINGNNAGYGNGTGYGGGVVIIVSSPTLTNVTINGNRTTDYGGGMLNLGASPTLINVTLSGNYSDGDGGGIYNSASSPVIRNSIIWGNTALTNGNNVYNMSAIPAYAPTYAYSVVEGSSGGWAGFGTDVGNNLDADPQFVAPVAASLAPTTAGNYRLQLGSPAIDAGNNSFVTAATDLDANPRIYNSIVDMGAYENQGNNVMDTTFYSDTVCQGQTYTDNNFSNLTVAGMYYKTLQGVSGDSLLVFTLIVNPVYFIQIKDTICDGGAYNFNGKSLTTADVYYDTLQAVSGCDSVVELELTVNPVYFIQIKDTICDGGAYNDANFTNLTVAGTYFDTLQTIGGCDSIIELTLTVNPVPITYIFDTICDGATYNDANFTNLTVAGMYYDTLQAVNSCDSIIALELTVNIVPITYIFDTICDGGAYNDANFTNLTVAGTYFDTLQAVSGCDSIIALELTVSSAITTYIFDTICDGATYNDANFTNLTVAGTYFDTLQNINGCDSIIELELTVSSAITTYIFDTICDGATYNDANFTNLTVAGTYYDTLQNINGCDSIIELELTVNSGYLTPIAATISQGDSYEFFGNILTVSGVYSDTLQSVGGCDSVIELTLSVLNANVSVEDITVNGKSSVRDGDNFSSQPECGSDYAEIHVVCDPSATVIINGVEENPSIVPLPKFGDNIFSITVIAPNGNAQTYTLTINKRLPFDQVIVMRWNNTLTVINNPANNGGFKFTSFKWFRNDFEISIDQSWSVSSTGEWINPNDEFYAEMTAEGYSEVLRTCKSKVVWRDIPKLYPNPVGKGQILHIEPDMSKEELKDAVLEVYDMTGKLVETLRAETLRAEMRHAASLQITIGNEYSTGVYLLILKAKNGKQEEMKVVVE